MTTILNRSFVIEISAIEGLDGWILRIRTEFIVSSLKIFSSDDCTYLITFFKSFRKRLQPFRLGNKMELTFGVGTAEYNNGF